MDQRPPTTPNAPEAEPGTRPVLLGVVFVGLLCGFIGVFVGLTIGGLRELRNTAELRADPLGTAVLAPALEASDSPVLLLGDSRVADWSPRPTIGGIEADAIGLPGLTAAQLAAAVSARPPGLTGRTVLVQVGVNDLKALGYTDRSPDEVLGALRANLRTIHEALAAQGARPVVLTIVPPGPVPFSRRFIWTELIDRSVAGINRELAEGSIVPASAVIDLRDLVGAEDGLLPEFAAGALELTPEGYQLISDRLAERLATPPASGQ